MVLEVLSILFQVMLPLSIPVVVGAILVRFKGLETKNILTLVLYFLMPGMVFETLMTAEVSFSDVYKTLSFCILNVFLLWLVAKLLGKALKLPSPERAGLTLVSTLTNSVNYGIPLVLLAFGQLGLDKASVYVIIQLFIVNTVGVYFAARSNFSVKNAVKSVFSLPTIYAALLACTLRFFHVGLPAGIEKGAAMIAAAYSPVVLAILGAQMAGVKNSELNQEARSTFWWGLFMRLIAAPLIACLGLSILQIKGVLFSVLFILSSMPVAVNAVILSEKFDASPKFVSKCILWTTLASFIVLPVLIMLVK